MQVFQGRCINCLWQGFNRLSRARQLDVQTRMKFSLSLLNCRYHFWLDFFQISSIFPTCFGCFLPANATSIKSLNSRNFNEPLICNIQSLDTWNLRDRDETWNVRDRDRDSQKWVSRLVSRPRPSLETPSLIMNEWLAMCAFFQKSDSSKHQ